MLKPKLNCRIFMLAINSWTVTMVSSNIATVMNRESGNICCNIVSTLELIRCVFTQPQSWGVDWDKIMHC